MTPANSNATILSNLGRCCLQLLECWLDGTLQMGERNRILNNKVHIIHVTVFCIDLLEFYSLKGEFDYFGENETIGKI